jgi:hypothetical protein
LEDRVTKSSLQEILIGLMRGAQKFLRGAAARRTGSLPHSIDDRELVDEPRLRLHSVAETPRLLIRLATRIRRR